MFDVDRRRVLLSTVATASTGTAVGTGSRLRASGTDEEPTTNRTSASAADDGSTTVAQETGNARETTDGDGDDSDRDQVTEADSPEMSDDETGIDATVEFLDCYRVRITGDCGAVLLGVSFEADDGQTGTMVDPVGDVDGERTIDPAAEFDLPAESCVLEYVELFETGPATPGLGDERVENPTYEECYDERLGDDQGEGESTDPVEFLDCETVRVTESADDVLLSLSWWDEGGLLGTIAEPVGAADGDRTVSATEEFGSFAHGPIITEVELFEAGTPVVPGGGDILVSNPNAERCAQSVRENHDGSVDLEPVEF